jgi:DNA-3-methyladenine glycosylase
LTALISKIEICYFLTLQLRALKILASKFQTSNPNALKLPPSFYQRQNVVEIAQEVLGKILFTKINGKISAGMIVETEAYSRKEKGCHAFAGKTERNKVMFEKGGVAYVYLCYGIHHLFNIVTNEVGNADAVLIRALQPWQGEELMMQRMNVKSLKKITSGPGKLTKALGIDRSCNGKDLSGSEVWIEDVGQTVSKKDCVASARIGIDYAGKDALLPWRFSIRGNEWVSKGGRGKM